MADTELAKNAGRAFGCVVALASSMLIGGIGCACGGFMMGVAGETTFGLVAPFVCESDEEAEYECRSRSFHQPGECEPEITCVTPSGETRDETASGLLAILGISYSVVFIPVFLFFGGMAWFVPGKMASSFRRRGRGRRQPKS